MATSIFTDPRFLDHDCRARGHPESPARLAAILAELARAAGRGHADAHAARRDRRRGRSGAQPALPAAASRARRRDRRARPRHRPCRRAATTRRCWRRAPRSARSRRSGAAARTTPSRWCARPATTPRRSGAMGFCLFNNAAIAAEAARRLGAERVMVLDWDVHHGNGTQHIFERRRDVLYLSSHQYPFYPGTGASRRGRHRRGRGLHRQLPAAAGPGRRRLRRGLPRAVPARGRRLPRPTSSSSRPASTRTRAIRWPTCASPSAASRRCARRWRSWRAATAAASWCCCSRAATTWRRWRSRCAPAWR